MTTAVITGAILFGALIGFILGFSVCAWINSSHNDDLRVDRRHQDF